LRQGAGRRRFVLDPVNGNRAAVKVLERYILGRAFVLSLGTLAATLLMVWIVQALTRLDLVTTNGASALAFLKISTLILPSIVPEVLPFAIAIAVAQTLTAMNADSELVVIGAAGSPRSTVMRPILLLGLGASLLSFAVSNGLDPLARLEFRTLMAAARADLISLVLQEGTFRRLDGGLYVQIAERKPGGELGGVFVADSREEGVDLVYYAKEGSVAEVKGNRILLMRDGMIQRKAGSGDVSVVRFHSYAFDLSQFAPGDDSITMLPKDRSLGFLLDPDPNDLMFQKLPGEFRAELHGRLSGWTLPLVFALIGLAVAGDPRSHRETRISPLFTVMVLALLVRWLALVASDQAESSPAFVAGIYAVPAVSAAALLALILASRPLELPVGMVEKAGTALGRLSELWTKAGMRMRGLAAPSRRTR
jgi:lipopolysaccharide export system permease protein